VTVTGSGESPPMLGTHEGLPQLTVVRARRVVTMAGPDVEAIAVVGATVLATGSASRLMTQFPHARLVSYPGATILPGFNDAHVHLTMTSMQLLGVDLSAEGVPDEASLRQRLSDGAQQVPDGEWLRGSRYDHTASSGGRIIDRADLDAVATELPVVVAHVGAHWGVVNSRALALAGVDDRTPDPPGGSYGRDAAGHLTGYVSEQAFFDFAFPSLSRNQELTPRVEGPEILRSLGQASDIFLRAGITSVGDAMVGPAELRLLQDARAAGVLGVRVNALVTSPHLSALEAAGVRSGFGDEWLRIGGIKAFVDGAVAGRSCAVAEPFVGSSDYGILTTTGADFQALVGQAQDAGLAVAVHANGERAIELALDAFEAVPPWRGQLRHRVEHCSIITPEILSRMAALDIVAVPFAGYPAFHGDKLLDWYGADRLERMFAHRSMLDTGLTVAGSSDYPCDQLSPLLGLESCVRRRTPAGRPAGLRQRITLREALALYSVGSAQASGEADHKGRLAPGYLADVVVLDGDLFAVPESDISNIAVLATWVGGEPRWTSS